MVDEKHGSYFFNSFFNTSNEKIKNKNFKTAHRHGHGEGRRR